MATEAQACSHNGCDKVMPKESTVIPEGWTHAFVENFGKKQVSFYHLYLCPLHTISTMAKQTTLFEATCEPDTSST